MTDSAETMREALRLLAAEDDRQSKLHELLEVIREQIRCEVAPEHRPDGLFRNIQDAVYAMRGRTPLTNDMAIVAALSASGTKSDGAKAIKTALIAAGCDTGDGSYVHAAMVSVIAAILADPIPSQPDKVEAIAETIWRAEYRRATGRERSVPWSEVSSTDRERYRYVADNILAMQAERRGVKP